MKVLQNILMVAAGGGLGALCRYGIALFAARYIGIRFPWGTLVANMTGCFLIGAAFTLVELRAGLLSPPARLFFITGFLGALTTFSTYALESVNAMKAGSYVVVTNFLVNNIGGGLLVLAGMGLVRYLVKG